MKLENLRKEIDTIDNKILILLSQRIEIVKKIGLQKKVNKINLRDKKRETKVIVNIVKKSVEYGLAPKATKKIWKILFEESIRVQRQI